MDLHHFSDIHTHIPGKPNSILSIPLSEVEGIRVSNTLLPVSERQYFSLQLHPWHLRSEADIEAFIDKANTLRDDPQLVAIGECGLDGLCDTPLPLQRQAFRAALQVAHQLHLPVIIHCVKLWSELIAITKDSSLLPLPSPLILHGFRKGPQLARQLLDAGFSFSIGEHYNPAILDIIPPERLYHETDAMPQVKKITVVGSSNMDLVVTTQDFPAPGQTVMGSGFMTNFGGKGANQAVAAARLGGDVSFISRVGDDTYGHEMRSHFEKEGINTSTVLTTSGVPTGTALITVNKHGENCIVVVGGANTKLSTEDIEQSTQAIEEADIVLMQLEVPVDALVRAAQLAKAKGKYVVLNPAPAPQNALPAELLTCIDLIIPNETEAYQLTGIEIKDDTSALEAIQKLQGLGIQDAMITIGSRGVFIEEEGAVIRIPACKVVPLDTTAAGDTFCGALCVALAQGMPRHEAVLFANRAASYTVQHRGAQCAMPLLKDILDDHN